MFEQYDASKWFHFNSISHWLIFDVGDKIYIMLELIKAKCMLDNSLSNGFKAVTIHHCYVYFTWLASNLNVFV